MKRNVVVAGYTGRLGSRVLNLLDTDERFTNYTTSAYEVGASMPERADVLVCAIGAYMTASVLNGHIWEHMFKANFEAPSSVIKAFVQRSVAHYAPTERRLIICVTASGAWFPEKVAVGKSAYTASKAAMSAFLAGLKAERSDTFDIEEWQPVVMDTSSAYDVQASSIALRILRHVW
jgi:NAD(P)-dependent dehydrogenase (short-subunit alcohol dehydrogenase family)